MEYKKIKNYYIVRIDKNEEIIESLKKICDQNKIRLGTITGVGAIQEAIIGLFDPVFKKYYTKELKGAFEITSLTGNISSLQDECFVQLYINVSDIEYQNYGGHLDQAIVSTSCEIVITEIPGKIDRKFDEECGLHLLDL